MTEETERQKERTLRTKKYNLKDHVWKYQQVTVEEYAEKAQTDDRLQKLYQAVLKKFGLTHEEAISPFVFR